MKKSITILIFCILGMGLYGQSGMKIGIHGGLPINEFKEEASIVLGLDVGYRFALGEVVDFGVMTGFVHGFSEKYHLDYGADLPSIQFVPLAGSVRIWLSNSFSFGADVGQALGINEGNKGGFYYRPTLGYLMGAQAEAHVSYTGIKLEEKSWNTISIGIMYTFDF
ncbi:hypothetical protein KCTC52924_00829 [Arenibacter antarcticus]|uniref:Outer membrane protein beta-barrel domain-containing protein n=1 Tax=Arenibacter antarcticus TaxID=2040469 RepID=A0ABW5VA43_9FLAO|nr:hypothetical protein [Arenibacter sp. H213]MCM4167657.1 hypothetical protein [Arenibacter sp. H213]